MEKLEFCFVKVNDVWKIWENKSPFIINRKGMVIDLVGFSQGSLRTNFLIKNANISFDAGLSCPYGVDHVLLTHGHCDHSASIFFFTLRNDKFIDVEVEENGKKVKRKEKQYLNIYVPEQIAVITDMKIQCDFLMTNGYKRNHTDSSYKIIATKHGDSIPTKFMGNNATFDIFRCFHGDIACVGYGITIKIKQVKQEYINLTPNEKKELGKKKIQLMEIIDYPYILYLGDTDCNILKSEEEIKEITNHVDWIDPPDNKELEFNSRIKRASEIDGYKQHNRKITDFEFIMIECNFLDEEHYNEAIERNHMHYRDIRDFAFKNPSNKFMLYHFSKRYTFEQIEMFFHDPINNCPSNIRWWNCGDHNEKILQFQDRY